MAQIRIKDIEPGMVLSEDVVDKNGRFILGKGAELAQKHIMAFKAWGISSVSVEGDEPVREEVKRDVSDEMMQTIKAEISERFTNSNTEHVFIKALMEKAIDLRIAQPSVEDEA